MQINKHTHNVQINTLRTHTPNDHRIFSFKKSFISWFGNLRYSLVRDDAHSTQRKIQSTKQEHGHNGQGENVHQNPLHVGASYRPPQFGPFFLCRTHHPEQAYVHTCNMPHAAETSCAGLSTQNVLAISIQSF